MCETVCTLNPVTDTTHICPFTCTMSSNGEEPLLTVPSQRHDASLQAEERRNERAKGRFRRASGEGDYPHLGLEKGDLWWECVGIIVEWVGGNGAVGDVNEGRGMNFGRLRCSTIL